MLYEYPLDVFVLLLQGVVNSLLVLILVLSLLELSGNFAILVSELSHAKINVPLLLLERHAFPPLILVLGPQLLHLLSQHITLPHTFIQVPLQLLVSFEEIFLFLLEVVFLVLQLTGQLLILALDLLD